MHPAYSVLFLTTLIGLGQGLFLALYTGEVYAAFGLVQESATPQVDAHAPPGARPFELETGHHQGFTARGRGPRTDLRRLGPPWCSGVRSESRSAGDADSGAAHAA